MHDSTEQNGLDHGDFRRLNPSALRILSMIWNEGPIARTTLADRTGLAHSSITRITRVLEEQQLIVPTSGAETARGRPPIMLTLNTEAGVVLAVDLGAIALRGAIYNIAGENLYSVEQSFTGVGETRILAQIGQLLRQLQAICKESKRTVLGIAISVPGVIDQAQRRVVEVTNLDLHDFDLVAALEAEFDLPVFIEHDTMAAAYAERFYGAGVDSESLIYITVSQGIGAGILLNNKIFRGVFGAAGELGHITIKRNGPRCLCGRRGCLEALAGAQAILAQVRDDLDRLEAMGNMASLLSQTPRDAITMEMVLDAASRDDAVARAALERAANYVAQAIGILATTLDVSRIIVGGEIAEADETFLKPLRRYLPRYLFAKGNAVTILPAQLQQEASIKGVSILALQEVLGLER